MITGIINAAIMNGPLIAAALLIRLIFNKASKRYFYIMWGLVGLRLALPIHVESIFGLAPSTSNAVIRVVENATEIDTVQPMTIVEQEALTLSTRSYGSYISIIFFCVWLIVVVAMLTYALVSYFVLKAKLATAIIYRDNIRLSDAVSTPFVLGIMKPIIYMPYELEGIDTDLIIAHERVHIRRHDNLWKPIAYIILAFYWFSPLVWIAYTIAMKDIELSCDECVIRSLDASKRKEYAGMLLNCTIMKSSVTACPLAVDKLDIKSRIKSIVNYKKQRSWITGLLSVILVFLVVCLMTSPMVIKNKILDDPRYESYRDLDIDSGLQIAVCESRPGTFRCILLSGNVEQMSGDIFINNQFLDVKETNEIIDAFNVDRKDVIIRPFVDLTSSNIATNMNDYENYKRMLSNFFDNKFIVGEKMEWRSE